jgi:FtsZ-interacting cell division protein ZipA
VTQSRAQPEAQLGALPGGQPGAQPKARPAAQLTVGQAGAEAWRAAAGEQGAPPTADPAEEGSARSAQQQHRGQRHKGQQECPAQLQPQVQRRAEEQEGPSQQQPQGQRHKERQARRVSDLHSHGGFPPTEGQAARTAAQQQARPDDGAHCIKRADRCGPAAAAATKQQKQAGALISAILVCCLMGSELLVSAPVEHGIWDKVYKRGPKTSSRRRCRGPCKEKRRATRARVQRGRKSQLLPD